ncbi:uncharacterized protein DS421_10g288070 [Arachis hypogaea]|nr:uncharacterized protein DS421_10g288070 [Arachis hypogaea]
MAHSSTSTSHSKKTQPFHFRATLQTPEIAIVAKIRTLHQHNIELSIKNLQKKQSYNTQETMATRNQAGKNQTKDLKCATHLLSEKFTNMSEEKKTIVRNLGFSGLMHIPPLRVHHQILRELANSFKLGENKLETGYGSFKIRQKTIGAALGINASGDTFHQKVNYKKLSEDDKQIFRRFQERNWGGHVLSFIVKGITDYKVKKKKEIDGCLFALMIIYFHLSKNKDKKREERPPEPWIANWTKEQLVERMRGEMEDHMGVVKMGEAKEKMKEIKKKEKKEESKKSKKERENNEKSAAQGEKQADLRSTEGHYVSSETIPDVNLKSDDPSSQGHTEQSSVNKPAESVLSLFEESASELAEENMMVIREETPSEVLAIVPIQVYLPLSQTTTTPETENEPTPLLQIEGTTKSTPEPPNNLKKAHQRFPQHHLKSPKDAAALMTMVRTVSYVPKADPLPSFSLGLTDLSQEEAATQEGASTQEGSMEKTPKTPNLLEQLGNLVKKIANSGVKEESKSPQIQKESGGESSGKFETPVRINQNTAEMKEKCYIWRTRLKKYADGRTNEFDDVCTLIAQDKYILTKMHLASLKAKSYIETEIVSAMCLILNQKNDKRFQEKIYCLPLIFISFVVSQFLQNMAISKHPKGEFISPTTNKEFRVEDYPMFIPFIDAKKLTSHRYGYVISRMRVYAGGAPLKRKEKEKEIRAPYVNISGQKTSYDCAIYVMK